VLKFCRWNVTVSQTTTNRSMTMVQLGDGHYLVCLRVNK
jgi:hypothetical protein